MRRSILSHSEECLQAHSAQGGIESAGAVTHRLGVGLLASMWWRQLVRRRPSCRVFGTWRVATFRDRSSADVGHGNGGGLASRASFAEGGRAIEQRSMFGAELTRPAP